jgi:hypothetical protein
MEHMRPVTRITAPILLADVGDHCFGVFSLDLKSSDERIVCVHGQVVDLSIQLNSDGKLHGISPLFVETAGGAQV